MIDRSHSGSRRFEEAKRDIDSRFPPGRFVAVENDRVVADAQSHRELLDLLRERGKTPKGMLIVQAGIEYPDSAVLFVNSLGKNGHA